MRRLTTYGLQEGRPTIELHALTCGGRAVATFGALPGRDRLCGLILAHDPDPEIASCGPGRLLLQEVIRSGIERGFKTLDLGVGEARYKREHCEKAEPLFDLFLATTTVGRPAAAALSLARGVKARVKRSPRLMAVAAKLRAPPS